MSCAPRCSRPHESWDFAQIPAHAQCVPRFESVVLVQSTERMASPMPEALLVGIDEVLAAVDVSLVLARLPDDQLVSDLFVPKVARELLADGLIINYNNNLPHRLLELIADHQLPAVWINSRQGETSVRPDDLQAGEDATQCLINHGHTRILYVDFFLEHHSWIHYSRKDRLAGYRTAMARAGLKQLEALPDFPVDPSAYAKQTIERLMPTAVIGYGEYETSACMLAALRAGPGYSTRPVVSDLRRVAAIYRHGDRKLDSAAARHRPHGRATGVGGDA